MNKKKGPVIITGGSGFIGEKLIAAFQDHYTLIILDKIRPTHLPHEVDYKRVDLTSAEDMNKVMKQIILEYGEYLYSVIHLAGFYAPEIKEDRRYEEVNFIGTKNIVKELFNNFDVGQFIYSSSLAVYHPGNFELNEGSQLCLTKSGYSWSKRESEKFILNHISRIPSVILRIAPVYDEFGHAPIIAKEITALHELSLTTFFINFLGENKLTHIHIDDLCEVFVKTLESRNELRPGIIFNVGEDETLPISDVRKIITQEILGRDELLKIPAFLQDYIPVLDEAYPNFDLNSTRVKVTLKWKPLFSLKKMIPVMLQNLINYPGTWYRINKLERHPIITDLRKKVLRPVLSL